MTALPLSVVIPCHRRADLLRLCLASVARHAPAGTEVIVVDDAAPGGAVRALVGAFPGVRLVRLPRRRGFCGAANVGIAAARAPVVELLNDDTEVTVGWAGAALACFADPRVAAVAPLVLQWPANGEFDGSPLSRLGGRGVGGEGRLSFRFAGSGGGYPETGETNRNRRNERKRKKRKQTGETKPAGPSPPTPLPPSRERGELTITRIDSAGDGYDPGGFARKLGHGESLSPARLRRREVFGASASSAFYRRDLLLRVGAFPERFGAYFEDVDLAFRLHRAGGVVVYEPASRVLHRGGSSYGRPSRKLVEQQSCNEERVFWRNLPGPDLVRALPRHLAVLAGKAVRRWREGMLLPWACGRLRAWAEVMDCRRHEQQLARLGPPRRVSAWQVVRWPD
jgi:GT2 family glycosyltransferase